MQRVLRNQVMCPRAECLSEVPLHVLFCELGGQRLHEKRFFHVDHFVPLIQFYNQSRKRKRGLQHLQTKTKKSKIDVKRMFNSTFKNQALVLNSQLVKILQVFLQNAPSSIFKTELWFCLLTYPSTNSNRKYKYHVRIINKCFWKETNCHSHSTRTLKKI